MARGWGIEPCRSAGEISFRPFIMALFPRCRRRVGALHIHAVALSAFLGDSFLRLRRGSGQLDAYRKKLELEITRSGEHLDARLERLLQSAELEASRRLDRVRFVIKVGPCSA